MIKLLIVSATRKEIAPFLEAFDFAWDNEQQYGEVMCGGSYATAALITGVGMVNTIFQLQKLLSVKKFDIAVNAGIAGSYNPQLKIGDVVQVHKDCFALLGNVDKEQFNSLLQMDLMDAQAFPFTNGWLIPEPVTVFEESLKSLPKVNGITVTTAFVNNIIHEIIKKEYQPEIESMEGAAFFYCCMQYQLPCLQIRAISNYTKSRKEAQWDINVAIKKLNAILIKMML